MNSSDSKAKSPSRSSTDGPLLRSFWSVPERHVEGVAAVSTSSKSSFSGQERELVSALFVLFGIGAIPGNETVDES